MDLRVVFKLGVFILTIAISAFFIWSGFMPHGGDLAALIVLLAGLIFLFCYELYIRLLRKLDWIKQDILRGVHKELELVKQDLGDKHRIVNKELENVQLAQVHNLHRTDRMMEVIKKLVDHIEKSFK